MKTLSTLSDKAEDVLEDIKEYFENPIKRWAFAIVGIIVAFSAIWYISSNIESDRTKTLNLMDSQQTMEDSVAKIANIRANCEVLSTRERNAMIEDAKTDIRNTPKYKQLQLEINTLTSKTPSIWRNIWEIMMYSIAAAMLTGGIMQINTKLNYFKMASKANDGGIMQRVTAVITIIIYIVGVAAMVALAVFRPTI